MIPHELWSLTVSPSLAPPTEQGRWEGREMVGASVDRLGNA